MMRKKIKIIKHDHGDFIMGEIIAESRNQVRIEKYKKKCDQKMMRKND